MVVWYAQVTLDIIVEALGRVNFGCVWDFKGLTDPDVRLNGVHNPCVMEQCLLIRADFSEPVLSSGQAGHLSWGAACLPEHTGFRHWCSIKALDRTQVASKTGCYTEGMHLYCGFVVPGQIFVLL